MTGLGIRIRAHRLGYGWTGTCFMRISGDGPFRVDIRPADELPPKTDKLGTMHRVWWEGDGGKEIVESFACARVRPKHAFTVTVDDDGNVIR